MNKPTCAVPGCGSTDTRPYLSGPKCGQHSNRVPVPDPALALDALRDRMLANARQARDAAVGAAVTADVDKTAAALSIVRAAAQNLEYVSANDVRPEMEAENIPGQLRGPAFAAAVKAGYLEPVALETSTDRGTHAKPVQRYRSLIYTRKERRMSSCRSCRQEIFWLPTTTGKKMPVNPDPDPRGLVAVSDNNGRGEIAIVLPTAGHHTNMPRYTSHFATCPNSDQHRRTA